MAALGLLQGCSSDPIVAPAAEFRFQMPAPEALTLDEIERLKKSLCTPDGEPPVHALSAAVFDDFSDRPRAGDPGWRRFLKVYRQVRDDAIRCGWSIEVEGFTQSSDAVGTADDLAQRRADITRQALVDDLGYPADSVTAKGRGVGGPVASDRRVDVKFVRR